jgi:pimeloyl-ACP methyl ester carboxylesterase
MDSEERDAAVSAITQKRSFLNIRRTLSLPADLGIELARLSANGSRVVATGSTHYMQIDRPDVLIAAIRRVLDAARSTSK